MPMPKPMPVDIEVSRFLTAAVTASRSPVWILPVTTRLPMSSSIASQRFVAFSSGTICSRPKMSAKSIAEVKHEAKRPDNSRLNYSQIFRSVLIWNFAERGCARSVSRSAAKMLRLVCNTAALRSNHALQPVENHASAFQPPAERIQHSHLRRQQRNSEQQHADVAEENNYRRKQIALARDVRLLRLQNMKRQREVKRIRRADAQMKPHEIAVPVPDEISQREHDDDQHDIQREKIRRERDDKIRFGNDNVAAFGRDLHLFDLPAEQPRPQHVCQFMAEDVNPHRLGQQKENDDPARRAGEQRNPRRVRAAARVQHF